MVRCQYPSGAEGSGPPTALGVSKDLSPPHLPSPHSPYPNSGYPAASQALCPRSDVAWLKSVSPAFLEAV